MATLEACEAMLSRIEEKVDHLGRSMDNVIERLYGNGKPGIIVDQAVQAKQITDLLKCAEKNAVNIKKLEEYTPDKWIAKNWKSIATALVLIVLLLHSIMPPGFSIWELIEKILGL